MLFVFYLAWLISFEDVPKAAPPELSPARALQLRLSQAWPQRAEAGGPAAPRGRGRRAA